jgi:dTDP-L-rhamnose 4-epimerase
VTGGAGFIGCAVSSFLVQFGLPVIYADNLLEQVHPSQTRPQALHPDVTLIKADVRDDAFWASFMKDWAPSIVLHLAAETGTGQSLTESARHASVNVTGTAMMLDAFARADHRPEQFVLTSSRAVYGEGKWITPSGQCFYAQPRSFVDLSAASWLPKGAAGQTGTPLPHRADKVFPSPTSVYGATKLTQEHMLSAWAQAFGVPLTVLRLQNVYGPGQSPFNSYTGIMNIFHRLARAGEAIEVYEDGDIGRDFVFITDVANAISSAILNPPEGVRTLDVGTGVATTIHQAAITIAEMHGAPSPVVSGKFRNGDVRWAVADPEPLKAQLNVSAQVDMASGMRLLGDWLVANGFA